jgi:hypothetical protein
MKHINKIRMLRVHLTTTGSILRRIRDAEINKDPDTPTVEINPPTIEAIPTLSASSFEKIWFWFVPVEVTRFVKSPNA